jgi:predicted metal-dependent hydrolase
MRRERFYFLEDIGEILIKKRKGSRRMTIRVNSDGNVRVTIPVYASFIMAEKFLEEKKVWLEKTLKKMKEKRPGKLMYNYENLPRTKYHEFILTAVKGKELSFKLSQGLCEIFIPESLDIKSEDSQAWIRKAIIETLRKEAKHILVKRTLELASENGFRINSVRIKNMKTRWGSCSTRGNINLNLFLMRLPEHLRDYIIYHELVHTLHHNHSKAFWNELDRYVGDAKLLAGEVRKWGWVLE